MGTKGKDWAWGALGIARTSDKDAIHAAFAIKRAELDAQAMRISAFAQLTEAREKALFIASEMLREEARNAVSDEEVEAGPGGQATVRGTPKDEPAPAKIVPAEVTPIEAVPIETAPIESAPAEAPAFDPAPEPSQKAPPEPNFESDYKGPWEHAGGYKPAFDTLDELADDAPLIAPVEPGLDPDPDEEWSHAGDYTPEAERTVEPSQLLPAPGIVEEASEADKRTRAAVKDFFERYPIKTYWVIYGLVAFFLLRSCA